MKKQYDFFIAGRARNRDNILQICDIFDELNISYYCFLKPQNSYGAYSEKHYNNVDEKQDVFEKLDLNSDTVTQIFQDDMEAEKNSKNFLLVLPAGKSGHIEAGVAYGLGKKCYAIGEYDATDSLYHIFEKIFTNSKELKEFLNNNKNNK